MLYILRHCEDGCQLCSQRASFNGALDIPDVSPGVDVAGPPRVGLGDLDIGFGFTVT